MNVRHNDYTDAVREMIAENERRRKEIFASPDQRSGKGIEGHTERCYIPDYMLQTQWLYPETFNHPLYQQVLAAGSIKQFVEDYNGKENDRITAQDVEDSLFITRCKTDPSFVFATCFYIVIKETGEKRPFLMRYAQRRLLAKMEEQRRANKPIRLILLKARQWGGSTLVQLYMAWIQLFLRQGWNSIIVAQTDATSRRIKAMYSLVLEKFPAFIFDEEQLQFSPKERSNSDFVITNSSRKVVRDNVVTVSSYEHIDSEAGANVALAHFSEVALWKATPSKTPDSVIRVVDGGMLEVPLTLQVLESTARGRAGYFYDEWQEAKAGRSSREALFVPFYEIEFDSQDFPSPKHRRAFAEDLIRNKNQQVSEDRTAEAGAYLYALWLKGATLEHINLYVNKRKGYHDHAHIASEMPSDDIECFMYSGNLVFNADLIEQQRADFVTQPSFVGDIIMPENSLNPSLQEKATGNLRIWKKASKVQARDRYIVVVDVGGRSEKADFSVISVYDRWATRIGGRLEMVARWRGHLRYDLMAWKAVAIAEYYNHALLAFESNTFDKHAAAAKEYVEQGDHIRGILNTIQDTYDNLYMRPATDEEDIRNGILQKVGFQTNRKTKQDIVDAFIVAFEDGEILEPDERFYAEAAIYEQRTDGSYGNIEGKDNHDDIVMTDMIANYIHKRMAAPSAIVQESKTRTRSLETINESTM
jgi:hypothetical protein